MASLGLFGDDEAELRAEPKEADVFKGKGKMREQDKPIEMPETSESYEPQRLIKLLTQGKALQQIFAIESLPTTASTYGWYQAERVASELLTGVVHRLHDEEYAIAAARCVCELADLSETEFPATAAERCIMHPVMRAIDATIRHEYMCCEWLHALILLLPRLSRAAIESSVLPFALKHGDSSTCTSSRLLCCVLLGAIADACGDGLFVERKFLSSALGLCQDTELDVRCCMCMQLPALAAALGPSLSESKIAAELVELQEDEHRRVRAEAFRAVIALLRHSSAEVVKATLLPMILKTMRGSMKTLQKLQAEAAFNGLSSPPSPSIYGRAGVAPEVVLDEVAAAVDALVLCGLLPKQAASDDTVANECMIAAPSEQAREVLDLLDELLRVGCRVKNRGMRTRVAAGFPSVVRAWAALGHVDRAASLASDCLSTLAEDADVCTELSVSLLPLARIARSTSASIDVLSVFLRLLKRACSSEPNGPPQPKSTAGLAYRAELIALNPLDPFADIEDKDTSAAGSASTIAHMLGNAAQLVAALSAEEGPVGSGSNVARDVLAALLALETLAEGHGLIMEALIKQVDELVPWLDPASLHSQVVPLAMRVVASNSWQRHKRGAARIVLLCLRRLRFSSQRAEVSAWVVALASHPSYQMRLVFIDMLRQLLAAAPSTGCSRQFLKSNGFLEALFPLSKDKVPNVRIQVCQVLLPIKRSLRLPSDSASLEHLYSAQRSLNSDPDVDVRLTMDAIDNELSDIEVLRESLAAARLHSLSPAEQEAEVLDAERSAEEEALVQAEQEEKVEKVKSSANEMVERARASRASDSASSNPTGRAPRLSPTKSGLRGTTSSRRY